MDTNPPPNPRTYTRAHGLPVYDGVWKVDGFESGPFFLSREGAETFARRESRERKREARYESVDEMDGPRGVAVAAAVLREFNVLLSCDVEAHGIRTTAPAPLRELINGGPQRLPCGAEVIGYTHDGYASMFRAPWGAPLRAETIRRDLDAAGLLEGTDRRWPRSEECGVTLNFVCSDSAYVYLHLPWQ